jgi:hypothetical protein
MMEHYTMLKKEEWRYEYVDAHTLHKCQEFIDTRLSQVEIRIWATGGADILVGNRVLMKVKYCPFCGVKLVK